VAFARVDLSRFVCAVLSASTAIETGLPIEQQRDLVSHEALEFATFLLSCKHTLLQKEGCAALCASLLPFGQPMAGREKPPSLHDGCTQMESVTSGIAAAAAVDSAAGMQQKVVGWPGDMLRVQVDGEELVLRDMLHRLLEAGSITRDDCAPLLGLDST
jgi:hypothetical protein